MSTSTTLSTGPLAHLAMDYARLRAEGIRQIARLAGAQWTDFNTHDPGITILEQLCYAITDLGYRIEHPVADLIAGTDREVALPGPAAILTCNPVTPTDLRKLVLDVDGVGNAWIEASGAPQLPIYHVEGSDELHLQADPSDLGARLVQLTGTHHVLIQTDDRRSAEQALAQVAARLHASRGLGEDVVLALLTPHEVWIQAKIEVGPIEEPAEVLADIIAQIETHLAPPVRFTSPSDALAEQRSPDELFAGPALTRGFVLGELPPQRRDLRTSDLIQVIMNVPAVRAVRSLALATSDTAPRERWLLKIPPGHAPTLATSSELVLLRAGLPVRVDPADVQARLAARRVAALTHARPSDARSLQPPPGRDRRLAAHTSIQLQLPAAYGVGALGLPPDAPAGRRAQARQLAAYLQIFDQLLANAFAQLAGAQRLLSPEDGPVQTYFAQPITDPRLPIADLLRQAPGAHAAWLTDTVEGTLSGADSHTRRNRFLCHLLARFAEQLGDHTQVGDGAPAPRGDRALIDDRQAFLRQYPRLSSARGSGHDILDEPAARSGFAERVRLKLGLGERERLHVVEHVLLRPIPEDARQIGDEADPQVPLLSGVCEPDPWSLQVSFVFAARPGDQPGGAFEQLVARTLLAETPAHLRSRLHWFGDEPGAPHWSAFEAAWTAFRAAYRTYRATQLRTGLVPDEIHLAVRDARDRVIDMLGFGRTYPLRDLPVPAHRTVSPGTAARIPIEHSQQGVLYGLRDARSGAAILIDGQPIEVAGTGATIELRTPPTDVDVGYRILAVKLEGREDPKLRREAWLHTTVRVEQGVDPSLAARILDLPALDGELAEPGPTAARLAAYGAVVEVELLASQEGVLYTLRDDAEPTRIVSQAPVVGTSGVIVLRSVALHADLDLRIHGSRTVGDANHPELRVALLDVVLPLRIRADHTLATELLPAPVRDQDGAATLRLATTEADVEYQAYRRPLRDHEYTVAEPPPGPTITVAGDDGRTIHIERPTAALWSALDPLGPAVLGTGAALELPLAALARDSLVLVRVDKRHQPRRDAPETLRSSALLEQVQALLLRPDPRPALQLQVTLAGDATTGPLLLLGGQPGVFYELRLAGSDVAIALPAYFHQRDDGQQTDKGIDQLRIEQDLVVARAPGDEARPLLDAAPLPVGTVLEVRARKALSGLTTTLTGLATIAAMPALLAEPANVAAGESARVVIVASVVGERYRLLRGDTVLAEADGVGGRLELDTGPLTDPAALVLTATRTTPGALAVERRTAIAIAVTAKG